MSTYNPYSHREKDMLKAQVQYLSAAEARVRSQLVHFLYCLLVTLSLRLPNLYCPFQAHELDGQLLNSDSRARWLEEAYGTASSELQACLLRASGTQEELDTLRKVLAALNSRVSSLRVAASEQVGRFSRRGWEIADD